jgi:hypothetical protein
MKQRSRRQNVLRVIFLGELFFFLTSASKIKKCTLLCDQKSFGFYLVVEGASAKFRSKQEKA